LQCNLHLYNHVKLQFYGIVDRDLYKPVLFVPSSQYWQSWQMLKSHLCPLIKSHKWRWNISAAYAPLFNPKLLTMMAKRILPVYFIMDSSLRKARFQGLLLNFFLCFWSHMKDEYVIYLNKFFWTYTFDINLDYGPYYDTYSNRNLMDLFLAISKDIKSSNCSFWVKYFFSMLVNH
jgi:hypothetical protein